MLARLHDDAHIASRGHFTKTPGRIGANLNKENPGGRGGGHPGLSGKGQGVSKTVMNTPGHSELEPKRLFKGGKMDGQHQSISRAFALLDKTNKTPHPKSRKAVSIMTPVAGSAQKSNLKPFTPVPPLASQDAPQAAPRPSAGRLSIRAPRSVIRSFETPDACGRRAHWDDGDMEPGPDMDEHVQASTDAIIKEAAIENDEDVIEYMPPTATVPAYEPLFDMPDLKAFGHAVISLSHSYWPKDEIDVLSAIRDDELIDPRFSQPSYHDLSMLDPPEDNPFPTRKLPVVPKQSETRGRSASTSSRKEPNSALQTRPASVAAVRTAPTSRPPSRTMNRPASTAPTPVNSTANDRPASTVPSKFDASSTQGSRAIRRPGTSLGIRSADNTARPAGKLLVPKRTEAKTTPPQTHLAEVLAAFAVSPALDDEFLFDV